MSRQTCDGCHHDLAGATERICGLMMLRGAECSLYAPKPGFEAEGARRKARRPADKWRKVGGLLLPLTGPA